MEYTAIWCALVTQIDAYFGKCPKKRGCFVEIVRVWLIFCLN
ncbi:hypothetical protein BIFGAL_03833 [Bifidobacterium gallicum DSM 20093 = LMG 11596]|uniref:Uncharacterized protein n=1 Tax=Bifidobacterium gallicum DSM 20093 = LMG 11596 TaxID=561180 RepID=D1NVE8_9BIFI|nr:hypothetical protein BIFGAL_03833 [Bifidobacterium gallicum DSM 20093 = LMG 11596]